MGSNSDDPIVVGSVWGSRHCDERPYNHMSAKKQSRFFNFYKSKPGLLRCARNDGGPGLLRCARNDGGPELLRCARNDDGTDPYHQEFLNHLLQLTPHRQFCIAYSGGVDSHVLLHLMDSIQKLDPTIQIRAGHIHHGLNPKADQWEAHCEKVCANLSIPFYADHIETPLRPGESIEAYARHHRYQLLSRQLKFNECLLTGHTQTDQAETLLLQLFRGAGIKGLAAMPTQKKFGSHDLIRPLLSWTREDILNYAKTYELNWIEDDSNEELSFDRNYLRKKIFPALKEKWPQVSTILYRTSKHCGEADRLLNELAEMDLSSSQTSDKYTLTMTPLLKLSSARRRNALRYWIHQAGYRSPNEKHWQMIEDTFFNSQTHSNPYFHWDETELRRYQQKLYLLPLRRLNSADQSHENVILSSFLWDLKHPLTLPGLGTLTAEKSNGGIKLPENFSHFAVRFRQGGERCRLPGRTFTCSLKKLFQEWKIPPWQRDRIPLLFDEQNLVAVVGYCICEGFEATLSEEGFQLCMT